MWISVKEQENWGESRRRLRGEVGPGTSLLAVLVNVIITRAVLI